MLVQTTSLLAQLSKETQERNTGSLSLQSGLVSESWCGAERSGHWRLDTKTAVFAHFLAQVVFIVPVWRKWPSVLDVRSQVAGCADLRPISRPIHSIRLDEWISDSLLLPSSWRWHCFFFLILNILRFNFWRLNFSIHWILFLIFLYTEYFFEMLKFLRLILYTDFISTLKKINGRKK